MPNSLILSHCEPQKQPGEVLKIMEEGGVRFEMEGRTIVVY
jgi:hypothetical protein